MDNRRLEGSELETEVKKGNTLIRARKMTSQAVRRHRVKDQMGVPKFAGSIVAFHLPWQRGYFFVKIICLQLKGKDRLVSNLPHIIALLLQNFPLEELSGAGGSQAGGDVEQSGRRVVR